MLEGQSRALKMQISTYSKPQLSEFNLTGDLSGLGEDPAGLTEYGCFYILTSFRYWDIGENRLKLNTFTTQQQVFAGANRIYWCIYNGTSDY